MNRIKSFLQKYYCHLLAFLLPTLILLVAYALLGIYPFGSKSVLMTDMEQQYADYHAGFYDMLTQGKSLFYNFNAGLGLNFFGILSYYLASPLTLLILLFPIEAVPDAMMLIILLKVGLCGLGFSFFFARSKLIHRHGIWNAAFSLCFALSAFVVVYTTNFMWLDNVALLPIVLLGVERLVSHGKMKLFGISLFFCFITNFYISYMVGVFSFFYFLFFCIQQRLSLRDTGKRLLRFLLAALLIAGCAAFFLLPAFRALTSSYLKIKTPSADLGLVNSPLDVFAKLLPGSYDTLTYGLPNIFFGLFPLLLLPLYFLNHRISRREKAASAGMLLMFLLSFCINAFYLAWHAFQTPTWFPARFSFLFVFFCLLLAARALTHLRGIRPPAAVASCLAFLLCILLLYILKAEGITQLEILLSAVLLTAYLALLLWLLHGRLRQIGARLPALLLCTLMVAELAVTTHLYTDKLDKEFRYKPRAAYTDYIKQTRDAVAPLKEDDGFYRIESKRVRWYNDSLSLGYHGFSHYSSFSNQATNKLLSQWGFQVVTNYRYGRYVGSTNVTDSLLGIKYSLSTRDLGGGYEAVPLAGKRTAYRNENALPLGFMVDQAVRTYKPSSGNPLQNQADFLKRACGAKDPFTYLNIDSRAFNNLTVSKGILNRVDRKHAGIIYYTYTMPADGTFYFYLPQCSLPETARVLVNGKAINDKEDLLAVKGVVNAGAFEEGDLVQIGIEISGDRVSLPTPYAALLDDRLFAQTAAQLKTQSLQISQFTDDHILGTVQAQKDGLLFTSIPTDPGWSVKVDGKDRWKSTRLNSSH